VGAFTPKGERGHIAAAFSQSQSPCLPGIKEISRQDGNCHPGQDTAGNKAERKTTHRSQAHDEQKIGKTAEEKSEEAVHISSGEPLRPSLGLHAKTLIGNRPLGKRDGRTGVPRLQRSGPWRIDNPALPDWAHVWRTALRAIDEHTVANSVVPCYFSSSMLMRPHRAACIAD